MTSRLLTSLCAVAVLFGLTLTPSLAAANAFEDLDGAWKGSGTFSPLGGAPERVSCRVTYNVKGSSTKQSITCAGADYKVTINATINISGEKLSGNWSEATLGASGGVSGLAKGNTIMARIDGEKFTGRMNIKVAGASHTISITQFDAGSGKYRQVANLAMSR